MSNILPNNEESGKKFPPVTDTVGNNQNPDNNEKKMANLEDSSRVRVVNENGKDLIDIDIEHIDEGKHYRIEYQNDVYGLEKISGGRLVLYEVTD